MATVRKPTKRRQKEDRVTEATYRREAGTVRTDALGRHWIDPNNLRPKDTILERNQQGKITHRLQVSHVQTNACSKTNMVHVNHDKCYDGSIEVEVLA